MSDQPAVFTKGLTKRYGDTTAISGADLSITSGSVYGFLGPNGAGENHDDATVNWT